MSIATNIVDTVGSTPLIKLNTVTESLEADVFVKAEFFNPLFSVKRSDRKVRDRSRRG